MYVLDANEERIKTKVSHKVVIDNFRPHNDYSCQCYSFQDACPICTINRALKTNTELKEISKFYFCELRQDFILDINGDEYHISRELENFIQDHFSYGFYRRRVHTECLLLFTEDKTCEFREMK